MESQNFLSASNQGFWLVCVECACVSQSGQDFHGARVVDYVCHLNITKFPFLILSAGNPRSSTTPCWPKPVSTTTLATTSSSARPAVNTSGSAPCPSRTPEILTSSGRCQQVKEDKGNKCYVFVKYNAIFNSHTCAVVILASLRRYFLVKAKCIDNSNIRLKRKTIFEKVQYAGIKKNAGQQKRLRNRSFQERRIISWISWDLLFLLALPRILCLSYFDE